MYRSYSVPGNQQTVTTSYKTAISLISTSAVRPSLTDIQLGSETVPADNTVVAQIVRSTQATAGTSSAVVPQADDENDQSALVSTSGSNYTAEPTALSAVPIWGPVPRNQRTTYRWAAPPGQEIWLPASAHAVVLQVKLAQTPGPYTGQEDATIKFRE